jgi:hypothetical protein
VSEIVNHTEISGAMGVVFEFKVFKVSEHEFSVSYRIPKRSDEWVEDTAILPTPGKAVRRGQELYDIEGES